MWGMDALTEANYWLLLFTNFGELRIRKYADRLVQLHLKDMDADGAFEELGKGTMDLKGCIKAAETTPCNWLIYEQDVCKRPPFECAVASIAHLKKLLGK